MISRVVCVLAAAVTALNAEPPRLLYSTLLGGNQNELATVLVTDAENNAYLAGNSTSSGWPGNYDSDTAILPEAGFIIKFDAAGKLLYSRQLPLMNPAVAVDANGAAYVAGRTVVEGLATPGAYQSTFTRAAVLVMKLTPDGKNDFVTYFGTDDAASAKTITIRADGSPAICGNARADLIPVTEGALSSNAKQSDTVAYCSMFNADASRVLYATTLPGGANVTTPTAARFDSTGALVVTGSTRLREWSATPGALRARSRIETLYKFDRTSDTWQAVKYQGSPTILQFGRTGALLTPSAGVGLSSFAVHPADDTLACGATSGAGALICSTDTYQSFVFSAPNLFSVSRVIADPNQPGRFFASVSAFDGGVFAVDFNSNRALVTPMWRGQGVQDLAMWYTTGGTILYMITRTGDLMRSTDGGIAFEKVASSIARVFTASISSDVLYGLRDQQRSNGSLLVRSDDGGRTWSDLGSSFGEMVTSYPGALSAFAVDPENDHVVYAATGGGAFRSVDGGLTFKPVFDGLLNGNIRDMRFDADKQLWISADDSTDAFVLKIRAADPNPVFSTLLGGSARTSATGLEVTADDQIVITGSTVARDFPCTAAVAGNGTNSFNHQFVTELQASGEMRESRLFRVGGDHTAVSADARRVLLSGAIGVQGTTGLSTVAHWIMYDKATGEVTSEAMQAGSRDQRYTGAAIGSDQKLRFAGFTSSLDFAVTPDAVQPTFGGAGDAFFSVWTQ